MEPTDDKERRSRPRIELSEDQLEDLARRAAHRALENFYREVGKITMRSVLYILGAAVLSLAAWLGATGRLK